MTVTTDSPIIGAVCAASSKMMTSWAGSKMTSRRQAWMIVVSRCCAIHRS